MTSRKNSHGHIEHRREEAKVRQAAYGKLTPEQKLAQLDAALGKGKGAKKVRAQLDTITTVEKLKAKHNMPKEK